MLDKTTIFRANYRRGVDRLYFVIMICWFAALFAVTLKETFGWGVNLYTNYTPQEIILGGILVLIAPLATYVLIILLLKTLLWIISGFRSEKAKPAKITLLGSEGSYFWMIKKYHHKLILCIIVLLTTSVILAFIFAPYSSYAERAELLESINLNFDFDLDLDL